MGKKREERREKRVERREAREERERERDDIMNVNYIMDKNKRGGDETRRDGRRR